MQYSYEVVKYNKNIPGMVLLQNKEGWRCRTELHWHKEIEIVYLEKGHLDYAVNGKKYSLDDGDLFFCNSEQIHITNVEDGESYNKYLVLLLSHEFIRDYFKKIDSVEFDVYSNPTAMEKIKECMRTLMDIEEKDSNELATLKKNSEIFKIYYILLTECVVCKKNSLVINKQGNFNYAKKVLEYIGENYTDEISLNDMAALVGLSPAYFSKYFKNITGTSFYNYLNGIRLEHAIKDMLTRNLSVTDTAFENGFPNVKSFISMCKKVYGVTPAQYKKRYPEY